MKIIQQTMLDFHNVLIMPKITTLTSRSQVDLTRKFIFPNSKNTWTGIPVISSNMDTTGTFEVYNALKQHNILTAFHKHYSLDDYKMAILKYRKEDAEFLRDDNFMISTGISEKDYRKLVDVLSIVNAKWICIDVANGYMKALIEFCKKVRETYPDKIIVAGNVVSREMVEQLIINGGVDVVKVGIGSGAACLTRKKAGVGMPQLSAVMDCGDAAHGLNGFIISDGGITCPGDMAKAFGGGSDFVMCGGVFSGHDENPGEVIQDDVTNKKYKMFYGMSSKLAMEKHYGKMSDYRSSEGRVVKVPYKGSIHDTIKDYLGGVRSCCTYINAKNIKYMPKCTTFVLTSQQLNTSLVER